MADDITFHGRVVVEHLSGRGRLTLTWALNSIKNGEFSRNLKILVVGLGGNNSAWKKEGDSNLRGPSDESNGW
jgi:hypothetical protein